MNLSLLDQDSGLDLERGIMDQTVTKAYLCQGDFSKSGKSFGV